MYRLHWLFFAVCLAILGLVGQAGNEKSLALRSVKIAPSYFVPNQPSPITGKRLVADSDILAFIQTAQGRVLFTPAGASIGLRVLDTKHFRQGAGRLEPASGPVFYPTDEAPARWVTLRTGFGTPGARQARAELTDPTPARMNFFNGPQQDWQSSVPSYRKLVYRDVWPGIDVEYHGYMDRLEYRLLLQPGASPDAIVMETGAETLSLDEAGNLTAALEGGQLIMSRPAAWQDTESGRQAVDVRYEPLAAGRYRFRLGAYRPEFPLVIDPVLRWSTLIGGGSQTHGTSIAVDASGYLYLTGTTRSENFPTTPGAHDLSYNGGQDIYVTKIDPTGSGLVYSTYLGGSSFDLSRGIAVDNFGNALVVGETVSADFPVTSGAYRQTPPGDSDIFAFKLNPTGSVLLFSTFLGGSGVDRGYGIAVDPEGSVYVTGITSSANFPTTAAAFDRSFNGQGDAFVTKFNSSASALVYSTFLGGAAEETGTGIALDSGRNAYITGYTLSPDYPVSATGFDKSLGGGQDAFVTRLNTNGSTIGYSTFLGGADADSAFGIAVFSGQASITGETASTDFPVTEGAFDTTPNGETDAFVSRLNTAGTALDFSTFAGGSGRDAGLAIAVDSRGFISIAGETLSPDLPTTSGAFDRLYGGGGQDGFVIQLDPATPIPVFSTYLGGTGADCAHGIAATADNRICVTGGTASADFPVTPWAYDNGFNSHFTAFALRLDPAGSTLDYSTFLGGSADDDGFGIALDGERNVYLTGTTYADNFPSTGPDALAGSGGDAYVLKIRADGAGLVYATIIGGGAWDRGSGIAVNTDGEAYVTGSTLSADFPVTPGSFQTARPGKNDAFALKLNAAGDDLIYSTYLGGPNDDSGNALFLDAGGDLYVTGSAGIGFPTTAGAYKTSTTSMDAFVTKLNPDGTAPLYSTFLGGTGQEYGTALTVDGTGVAYVVGSTTSADFPTTSGVFDRSYGGSGDGFLVKIRAEGSGLHYSVFLGGGGSDIPYAIALDDLGRPIIAGVTNSANFPLGANGFDDDLSGTDGFVVELNPVASSVLYGTFLGGYSYDAIYDMAREPDGNLFVTGETYSFDFPASAAASDTTYNGGVDAFVTRINPNLGSLSYSSFLGGVEFDCGWGLAIDESGVWIVGTTASPDFPITGGSYDLTENGGSDIFAARFEIVPDTPSGLQATAYATDAIRLTWQDNSSAETGYSIERKTSADGSWQTVTTCPADTTLYEDTGLGAGTTHTYRIYASGVFGISAYSNEASATTFDVPPEAPSGLAAVAAGPSRIDLTWTDNAGNETGIRVERRLGADGAWGLLATLGANATTYASAGLAANTRYYYRVRAYNAQGSSPWSNVADAVTAPDTSPAAPTDLSAIAVSAAEIHLAWRDNSVNETAFVLEQKTGAAGSWAPLGMVGPTLTRYRHLGVTAGQIYSYRVKAVNSGGESAWSNEATATASATLPAAPSSLWATRAASGGIDLLWTDNAVNETGFKIERKTIVGSAWGQIATAGAGAAAWHDAGVPAGAAFMYRVRAYNAAGNSAYSNAASAGTADYDRFIPAAAHTAGAGASVWNSDVDLYNFYGDDATVQIALLIKDQDNSTPATATRVIPAGQADLIADILGTLFHTSNAALGFRFTAGRPVVNSRFYNIGGGNGTYGMYIDAVDDSRALCGDGATFGVFHQVRYSPDPAAGFRTNVGFVNASGFSVQVIIRLYGDGGEFLGARSQVLLPYEHRQFTKVHEGLGTPPVDHGSITVEVATAGGKVHPYVMLIDNLTGDPIYMPPELLSRY